MERVIVCKVPVKRSSLASFGCLKQENRWTTYEHVYLVGGLEHVLFSHILGKIIP